MINYVREKYPIEKYSFKDSKDEKEKTDVKEKDVEKESVLSIKKSDEMPTYWKPTKPGEKIEGKLVAIEEGNFGKVLKLRSKKEVIGINVGTFLADIDFVEFQNMGLRFTYKGKVGKRGCRVFDVDRVLEKDEVPF